MPKKLMPIFVCLLFIPFLTVPALMDERYWFLQGSAEMDFSASNILSYGASFDQAGRFMPLSGYLRSIHSYIGFETMTGFGIPLNIFEGLVHAFFLSMTFLALYWYLKNLPIKVDGHTSYLDKKVVSQITILAAFIFGGMASIRWQHNGLVAYVPMTFLPLITALLLATSARRLLIKSKLKSDKNAILKLICLAVFTSLWANLFYELAYVCVLLVVISCVQEFLQTRDLKHRKTSILHMFTYAAAFLIYWIPMRIYLAKECVRIECYEGSQISSEGLVQTFILNLVNPLPLIGPYIDLKKDTFTSELSLFSIVTLATIVIVASVVIFINLNSVMRHSRENSGQGFKGLNFTEFISLAIGPVAIGMVSALLMSVSVRSQRIVDIGSPYRHTPILWLGYSLVLAVLIVWAYTRYSKLFIAPVMALICAIMVVQQISSMNHSLILQRSQTTILKIYDEVIFPDFSEQGNERRCSLIKGITKESDIKLYVESSSEYFVKVLNQPYCQ
jgi:hypothetical protein